MIPLHDVRSAAKLLAVSPWTIRSYIRQGKLQSVRIGRLVRLEDLELQKFVNHSKCDVPAIGMDNQETEVTSI